jgi:streptomycin 3"-adenylyltransferase
MSIKTQVEQLTYGVRDLLRDNLLGIYLHGSLAMGCFSPGQSDLDVLVIICDGMAMETKRGVGALLLGLSKNPAPIEISFLREADMQPWRYPTPFDLHYSELWREHVTRDLESGIWPAWRAPQRGDPDLAAHITVTRQRGVCLYGMSISSVFPAVPRSDYIDSVMKDVDEALSAIHENPVYAVLNACRTLAFLCDGHVMSKDEGGAWALQHLPPELHGVVMIALEQRRGATEMAWQPGMLDTFAESMRKLLHVEAIAQV